MKRYLQILLLLISIFFYDSCINTKNFKRDKEELSFVVLPLLAGNFNTALYKSQIDIGKKHFSGLFYFKTSSDSSYRIVFLTEFGLSLLDLEYKNHIFKLVSCNSFLNRKIILNTLENNLRLLIDMPQHFDSRKIYLYVEHQQYLLKYRKNLKKTLYFCTSNKTIDKIIQTNGIKRIEVLAHFENTQIPQKIEIKNKRINLTIKLNLLKLK